MMGKNYREIVNDSLNAVTYDRNINYKDILLAFKKTLDDNKDLIGTTNVIDVRNGNGFIFDFDALDNIFERVFREENIYGKVTLSRHDEKRSLLYGKQIYNKGNILVVYDGNSYVLLEFIMRNILANNSVVFCYDGYNSGLNTLLINFIQGILENSGLNPLQFQEYITDGLEILDCTMSFDLVFACGGHELQRDVINKSHAPVITCGYRSYDFLIENEENINFIDSLLSLGINCNLYVLDGVKLLDREVNYVSSTLEGIFQINTEGAGYAATIFTDNVDNASLFMKRVKTKIVTVNSSPTLEDIIDIKQEDFYNEKTVIYPLKFNLENK